MDNASGAPRRENWGDYYRVTSGRPPRELLRQTLLRFPRSDGSPRLAIDLGCGAGIETMALLEQGWHVLAIDQQQEATAGLVARAGSNFEGRLTTQTASFENVQLPPADLIWAALSLPFCPPEHFPRLWKKITESLRPGGRFAGDFFGVRHVWAGDKSMTFHTAEQVRALCAPLRIEYFIAGEGERMTALHGMQPWHAYSVVAKKL